MTKTTTVFTILFALLIGHGCGITTGTNIADCISEDWEKATGLVQISTDHVDFLSATVDYEELDTSEQTRQRWSFRFYYDKTETIYLRLPGSSIYYNDESHLLIMNDEWLINLRTEEAEPSCTIDKIADEVGFSGERSIDRIGHSLTRVRFE